MESPSFPTKKALRLDGRSGLCDVPGAEGRRPAFPSGSAAVAERTGKFMDNGQPLRIDALKLQDIPDLRGIVEVWVRKDGRPITAEIEQTMAILGAAAGGNGDLYLVAREADGKPAGVMGCGLPDDRFLTFRSSPAARAAGLKTAFLSPDVRGRGLGKRLLSALFAAAGEAGWTEMLWSSNPRYRDTAWSFYTALAGEPVGILENFFAEGSRTPVWRKPLKR